MASKTCPLIIRMVMKFRASNLIVSNDLDPLFITYRHDFLRRSESTAMRCFRNRVPPNLAPLPSAGNGWSPAGAIQYVFFRRSEISTREIRPLRYGVKAIRYRVRHLGHFTQWRRKGDISHVQQDSSGPNNIERLRTLVSVVDYQWFLVPRERG